jgi:parvulin-like peptidyl-prolyl isomerase
MGAGLAVVALWAAGCQSSPPSGGPDAVVAKVNKTTLTVGDLNSDTPAAVLANATPEMTQEWVQQWIQSELLYQEALRLELHKDRKTARELQKMQRDYLANILLERVLSQNAPGVSEADIQQFYNRHQREFIRQEPELKLSVIVLKNESAARDAWRQLSRDHDRFGELARTLSIDTASAQKGGDLGYVKKSDISDPTLQRLVVSMRRGELSRPVRTESGYCILLVTDRHDVGSIRSLEEVRSDIVNRVLEERRRNRIRQLVDGLRKSAEVEVNQRLLNELSEQKPTALDVK